MRAYVTLLSTDSYLDGVLALNESLKRVGSKYPLVCALTPNISPRIREVLAFLRIETVEITNYSYSEEMVRKYIKWGFSHWERTAEKFRTFGLEQYEKIVFIDADMFILRNIDHLFNRPHLSACQDSPMLNWDVKDSHEQLNSGIVVLKPSKKFEQELIELSQEKGLSDQEALRAYYPNWVQRLELRLPQEYNIFVKFWEGYAKQGMRPENVIGLHFIGAEKPFHSDKILKAENPIINFWLQIYLGAIRDVHHQLEKVDFFNEL